MIEATAGYAHLCCEQTAAKIQQEGLDIAAGEQRIEQDRLDAEKAFKRAERALAQSKRATIIAEGEFRNRQAASFL